MNNIFSVDGKVAIVTGGSGYLGSAIVEGLIKFGASVAVLDKIEKSSNTQQKIKYFKCDLSDTINIKEIYKNVEKLFGKIDILINCAFYYKAVSSCKKVQISDNVWQYGIDGSIGVTFRSVREILPYFNKNNGGVIVNVASMYGMVAPDPGIYEKPEFSTPLEYGAGKAAVIQLTKYLASHLAKDNIRVNCITPGPFPHPQIQENREFIKRLNNKTMLGRIGRPEEIAGPAILLASNASSYMTGCNIIVDGGWTAW